MKIGIAFANTGPYGTSLEALGVLGQAADDSGIESLWTVEHVVVPKGYESTYPYDPSGKMPGGEELPIPDPLVWLTAMGAVTTSVKLATGILILPQRNPLVVAKECATIDQLSGGRLVLGVGAGWLQEEFDALDVPFEARGRRLDDYIGALRAAWGPQPASYDGEFVKFGDLYSSPQPVDGRVPIVIGGHSEAAARRAGRIGDGFFPGRGSEEELVHLLGVMRAAAEEAGRDPADIEVTATGFGLFGPDPKGYAAHAAELGVHRLMIMPLSYNPTDIGDALGGFMAKLS